MGEAEGREGRKEGRKEPPTRMISTARSGPFLAWPGKLRLRDARCISSIIIRVLWVIIDHLGMISL